MLGLLVGLLLAAAAFLVAWFLVPAYARGMMNLWCPTISDKWLHRWILTLRAGLALISLAIAVSVSVQVLTGP